MELRLHYIINCSSLFVLPHDLVPELAVAIMKDESGPANQQLVVESANRNNEVEIENSTHLQTSQR